MDKHIWDKFIVWLRRKHPGAVIHMRDFWIRYLIGLMGIAPLSASLGIRVIRRDGTVEDLGIVSTHAVTDAYAALLVDSMQASVAAFSTFKYHDSGTGTTAEAAADTAMETPTGEDRDTGTQVEGATANIYKSVATHTYAGTFDITEHGLFSALTGVTLADRSVFTAIGVIAGDGIQFTYQLTLTAGG